MSTNYDKAQWSQKQKTQASVRCLWCCICLVLAGRRPSFQGDSRHSVLDQHCILPLWSCFVTFSFLALATTGSSGSRVYRQPVWTVWPLVHWAYLINSLTELYMTSLENPNHYSNKHKLKVSWTLLLMTLDFNFLSNLSSKGLCSWTFYCGLVESRWTLIRNPHIPEGPPWSTACLANLW